MKIAIVSFITLLARALPGSAEPVPVVSYQYLVSSSGTYPDSTGIELTDGVTFSRAWGADPITFDDVQGLVGWSSSSPTIEFTFASVTALGSVQAYFADSDGAAGVAFPSSVTLSTPGGFSQSFPMANPPGAGTTVLFEMAGFSIITDKMTLTATPAATWTMLSEVSFFTPVPEPSTSILFGMGILLGAASLSKRSSR